MNPRRILTVGLITIAALAIVSRVPMLRKLILLRARTPGAPAFAGADAPTSITSPEIERLRNL